MEIKKKYIIKCDKCGKEIVFDVYLSKIAHRTFIDKMIINNKESKCKCLKGKELDICSIQILLRQFQYLNTNRDRIAIELEKQD